MPHVDFPDPAVAQAPTALGVDGVCPRSGRTVLTPRYTGMYRAETEVGRDCGGAARYRSGRRQRDANKQSERGSGDKPPSGRKKNERKKNRRAAQILGALG